MEKNIIIRFAELINAALDARLAEIRRTDDEDANQAWVDYSFNAAFGAVKNQMVLEYAAKLDSNKTLTDVQKRAMVDAYADGLRSELVLRQGKGYTFAEARLSENGVSVPAFTFSQRHSCTQEEYDSLADVIELNDIKCKAGLAVIVDEEGEVKTRRSMKWTKLTVDGEEFAFSGPVRKFHADTNSYDEPIIAA